MTEHKYIVGKANGSSPATMRFYGPVNEYSCRDFVAELDWLVKVIKPSEIVVFINSEGGSVISGMQVFSALNSCPIKTKCVIDGIAASMGSVIWSAGKQLYMRDYSILMVHNPFVAQCDPDDKDTSTAVEAFRQQIETIYTKRFGMSAESVRQLMDGEEGVDGTYMLAKDAVAKGILPAENIIETSEQVRAMMAEKTEGIEDAAKLASIMASVDVRGVVAKISEKKQDSNSNNTITNTNYIMDEKEKSLGFITASLGLASDAPASTVTAKVQELVNAQAKLKDVEAKLEAANKSLADTKIQLEGKNAEVANLTKSLEESKASLKAYQDAEAAAKDAKIVAMVEKAIKEGKIAENAKEQWVTMAKSNFELAESTLASIPAREDIVNEISKDPKNQETSADETQRVLQEKVKNVLGNFKIKKFGE